MHSIGDRDMQSPLLKKNANMFTYAAWVAAIGDHRNVPISDSVIKIHDIGLLYCAYITYTYFWEKMSYMTHTRIQNAVVINTLGLWLIKQQLGHVIEVFTGNRLIEIEKLLFYQIFKGFYLKKYVIFFSKLRQFSFYHLHYT